MHYTKVTIQRDETTSMEILVGAWEVPILEAVHGAERMTVGDTREVKNRAWPDNAASEMQRLNKLYGTTGAGDNAQTYAETVYGAGSRGIKALEKAIAEARAEAEAEAPKRGRPRKSEDLVGEAAG